VEIFETDFSAVDMDFDSSVDGWIVSGFVEGANVVGLPNRASG
jgi:hypothetical protein